MRLLKIVSATITILAIMSPAPVLYAEDMQVTGTISGTQTYDSPEGIVFNQVVMASGANITADSTFEVHLTPGTRIADGVRFTVRMKDNDGILNRCELEYFEDLNVTNNPDGDHDTDGLTDSQECILGYNPNQNNPDNDSDGLPDAWEFQYFGFAMADAGNDHDGDSDNDGITNYIEYRLKTDPTAVNAKGPGLHYEYDALGRVKNIQRIPSH